MNTDKAAIEGIVPTSLRKGTNLNARMIRDVLKVHQGFGDTFFSGANITDNIDSDARVKDIQYSDDDTVTIEYPDGTVYDLHLERRK